MPGALIQETYYFDGSPMNATQALAFPSNVTAGNALVASAAGWANGGRDVTGVTDTQGNTWTAAVSVANTTGGTQNPWLSVWAAVAAMSGSNTVTLTFSNTVGNNADYKIAEFSAAGAANATGTNTGHTTAAIAYASSGVQANAGLVLVISALNLSSAADIAPAGFTQYASANSSFRIAYRFTSTAEDFTTYLLGANTPDNPYIALAVVAFAAAGGGGGGGGDPVTVVDSSTPCCSTGGGGTTVPAGGGQGGGATPLQTATIGTQIACAGSGTVPTAADLVFAETWWAS